MHTITVTAENANGKGVATHKVERTPNKETYTSTAWALPEDFFDSDTRYEGRNILFKGTVTKAGVDGDETLYEITTADEHKFICNAGDTKMTEGKAYRIFGDAKGTHGDLRLIFGRFIYKDEG